VIYLLDTNVFAELTRPKPNPRVKAWFDSVPKFNRFLSVITIAEIDAGVQALPEGPRRARYAAALSEIRTDYGKRIISIDEVEAVAYVSLHNQLKANGTAVDGPDGLIAATALANGWTVASRNVKHLERTGVLLVNPWEYEGGSS
jgi:toxin FitB